MIDLLQAYARFRMNYLSTKLRKIDLPEKITNMLEYMYINKFVNTEFAGQQSEL